MNEPNKKNKTLKEKLQNMTPDEVYRHTSIIAAGSVAALVAIFGWYFMNFNNGISTDHTAWGTFGDFIGGTLNPIFGFLGLIAILLTVILQSKTLDATREELRATREEMKRSAHAQELMGRTTKEQSKIMKQQRFESTFFSLLEQHNKAHEKITDLSENRASKTPDIDEILLSIEGESTAEEAYLITQQDKGSIARYFSILHHLLKLVALNSGGLRDKNGRMYSDIVRSFVSNNVLLVLTVYCLNDDSEDNPYNLKELIEIFRFFELIEYNTLNTGQIKYIEDAKSYYRTAFGD